MCAQYWPGSKDKTESYGGIDVSYSHEEQLANFVIRNFRLRKSGTVRSSERLNKTTELYPSELGIKIRIDATKWLAIEEIPNAIRWINVARLEEVRLFGADVSWMIASSNMFLIRDREREKKRADGSSDGDMATGQTSHRWSNCLGDDVDDEIERRRRSSRSVHSPPSNDYSPGRRLGRLIDGRTLKKSFLSRSVSFASSVISNIPVACGGGGQNDASIGLASTENKKKVRANQKTETHARAQTTTPKNGRKPKMNNNTKRSVAPRQGSGSARKNGDRVVVVVIGGGGETTTFA